MMIRAISTEKALRLLETENTITFNIDRKARKDELKKELVEMFNVKIENIRTHITRGKKMALVRLKKESSAPELATKLGLM
jgi:large subunit ribosomal protein L23